MTLGMIQNIISFAHINTWWETLVKATIIVVGAGRAWHHQPVQEAETMKRISISPRSRRCFWQWCCSCFRVCCPTDMAAI